MGALRWPWARRPAAEPAPPPAPARPAEPAPSPMGWAFLPPIQRSLATPIEPVTRPTGFASDLSAWRSPAFTGMLSHAVVDTVPGGVIDGDGGGVGTPHHTGGPAPELTLLPPPRPTAVQRSATSARAAEEPPPPPADAPAEPPVPFEPVEAIADVAPVEATGPAPTDLPEVVRPEPPEAALTRASSTGLPLVQRSVVPEVPSAAPANQPEPVDAGPADLPVRPPLGPAPSADGAQPAAVRPTAVQRAAVLPTAAPDLPATPPAPVARPRLGLGPPLAATPPSAVSAPSDPGASDPAGAGEVPVGSADAVPGDPGLGTDPVRFAERAAASGFTEVPIQRSLTDAEPQPGPRGTTHPATPLPPAAPPAPGLTLAGPAASRPAVQRAVTTGPAAPDEPVVEPPAPIQARADHEDAATEHLEAEHTGDEHTGDEHPDPEPGAAEPAAGARGVDLREPAVAVEPPPAPLPSTPLPLAGGITTSIQRADLLPGPGTPTPSLVVRPAPLVPATPASSSRERVVRVQRLPVEPPPTADPAQLGTEIGPTRPLSTRAGSTSGPLWPGPVQRSASPGTTASAPAPASAPATAPASAPATGPASAPATGPASAPATAPHVAPAAAPVTSPRASAVPPEPASALLAATTGPAPDTAPAGVVPDLTPAPTVSRAVAPAPVPAAARALPAAAVLPLATPPAPAEPAGGQPAADGEVAGAADVPVSVQRSEQSGAEPPGPVTVQTATAPAPGAAPAAGGAGSATGDVDALAQRLFPAVLRRIKAELLLDRERRGVRTDPW